MKTNKIAINVIQYVFANRGSTIEAQKSHIKKFVFDYIGIYEWKIQRLSRIVKITFTEEDVNGLCHFHDKALVLKLGITNYDLKRNLIEDIKSCKNNLLRWVLTIHIYICIVYLLMEN